MMKADVAGAMLVLAALGIGRPDPQPRLAVGPADGVVIFVGNLESKNVNRRP
jgi:hypothetical protein